MYKPTKGFTLAEVLVTLAIIGVVATLTIPSFVTNSNQQKYIASLKKTISTLNGALITNIAENEEDASSSDITSDATLAAFFSPRLNVLKDNGSGSLWLTDGTRLSFTKLGGSPGCTNIQNPTSFNPILPGACYVIIDVNGDKKPNIVSYTNMAGGFLYSDVWILAINPKGIVPVALSRATTTVAALKDINDNPLVPAYTEIPVRSGASLSAVVGSVYAYSGSLGPVSPF